MHNTTTITVKSRVFTDRIVKVDTPACWERKEGSITEHLAILDSKTAISVFISPEVTIIKNCTPEHMADKICEAMDEASKWEEVGDGNFLSDYENALASISLKPVLV
jgi:hypothetical protein